MSTQRFSSELHIRIKHLIPECLHSQSQSILDNFFSTSFEYEELTPLEEIIKVVETVAKGDPVENVIEIKEVDSSTDEDEGDEEESSDKEEITKEDIPSEEIPVCAIQRDHVLDLSECMEKSNKHYKVFGVQSPRETPQIRVVRTISDIEGKQKKNIFRFDFTQQ